MATKQCKGTTRKGTQCPNHSGADGFCFVHSPNRAKERAEARKRGGQNRATPHVADAGTIPAEIKTVADVLKVLQYTLIELIAQPNGVIRARALIACALGFLKALEVGELEKRLEAVEAILKSNGGKQNEQGTSEPH
jgi:hypothetical protein